MKYNFDEIIDRKGTNAMNTDGFREYIFHAPATMGFPYEDDEFVRMWVADMEFATPPEIIQAIKDRVDKRIFGYTKVFDPNYYLAFVDWTKLHYNWSFPKEQLLTSPGIIPALYELVEYICKPDEKILIVTPSYAYFKHAADFNQIELVCSDLVNDDGYYTLDFADIEAKAKDEKVSLCIFCNPHNPSGRIWTTEELAKVGKICRDNGVYIISDEIHCDIIRQGRLHTPLAKVMPDYDKIVTCMAPSKTFNMAGCMLSNIIIPDDDLRALWMSKRYLNDNPLSIAAAQAAYEQGSQWLDELRAYLDGNFEYLQQFLQDNLPNAVFRIPEATYLGWVDVSAYVPKDVALPQFFADKAGVLLEGGNMFVQNSDGYIRLNLACPRAVLVEGLNRIATALKKG